MIVCSMRIEQRHVAAGLELQHVVAHGGPSPWPARVHDDQLRAALGGVLQEGRGDRMVLRGAGADDDDAVGVLGGGERRGDGARVDAFHQRRDRRGMAQPRAVVDVVGAEAGADELLEQIGFLVGALGRAEAGQRRAAVSVSGPSSARRPRRPAPLPTSPRGNASRGRPGSSCSRAALRRVVAADQRLGQAVRVVDVVEAEAALDAQPVARWPGRRGRRRRGSCRP